MSGTTPEEIEAEIARTRTELRSTVEELSERLNPRTQAAHAADEAKIALVDLKRRVTGEVRPLGEPEPSRTGWVVIGAAAAAAAALVGAILRKR
ncbi:DUF3618 domain-containing protein [Cellulomonas sp. KRMCY2]|uniref:DUF3618 domain-containing protein n=1 Tax=Cellulomonas sp. KRMCY2 TaxID=1304865 RepID=UPI00045E7E4A|nr:DUF3618 domain-containing protein [Cellulomonas sp. KRMCY2]